MDTSHPISDPTLLTNLGSAFLDLFHEPRIVVVGTAGAGKTTTSRQLAALLGRRHVELDALFWNPEWIPNPRFQDCVAAALSERLWIVDGNYRRIRDILWTQATTLIWLNLPLSVVLYRVLARTARRLVTREEFLTGNRESLRMALSRDSVVRYSFETYRELRRDLPGWLSDPAFQHLKVVELRSRADVKSLLDHTRMLSTGMRHSGMTSPPAHDADGSVEQPQPSV